MLVAFSQGSPITKLTCYGSNEALLITSFFFISLVDSTTLHNILMATTYKAALLAITLVAVCSLTLAYDCPDYVYPDDYAVQYRSFEEAMLDNKNNPFRLHTAFFPPGYESPVYGWIRYDIYVQNKAEPESRSGNGTLPEPTEILNCYEYSGPIFKHWSSSLLLAHIDPLILNSFQLYALELTFYSVELALTDSASNDPSQFDVHLEITIDNVTYWNPNRANDTLDDITSWVSYS